MRVLICVKQVPVTSRPVIDPVTGILLRSEMDTQINPFDRCALEVMARCKEQNPDTRITALCMGPYSAKSVLRDALAYCADEAVLIQDPAFAGSDAMATSRILAAAVQRIEEAEGPFDLVVSGAKSVDGETSVTGPLLAERLGLFALTYAVSLHIADGKGMLTQETDTGTREVSFSLPCLITFSKTKGLSFYPKVSDIIKAQNKHIRMFCCSDLPGLNPSRTGVSGSASRVVEIQRSETRRAGIRIVNQNTELTAQILVKELAGIL